MAVPRLPMSKATMQEDKCIRVGSPGTAHLILDRQVAEMHLHTSYKATTAHYAKHTTAEVSTAESRDMFLLGNITKPRKVYASGRTPLEEVGGLERWEVDFQIVGN